jgi:hypothetical protein
MAPPPDMRDTGYLVGSLTSWAMVGFGLYRLWRVRWLDRGRWALTGAFFFSAVSQLVQVSAVAEQITRLFGLPNLDQLASNVGAMGIGVCEAILVAHWTALERPMRKLHRRLAFSVACLVGYVVTFSIGNDPTDPRRFSPSNVDSPAIAVFMLIYVVVQISYLADIAVVAWRFSRVAQRTWMRSGLRIAAVGGVVGVAEALSEGLFVIASLAGAHPENVDAVNAILVMTASLFLLAGWATPALEPRLGAVRNGLRRYNLHRKLYPLWRALFDAMPAIALEPPASRWAAVWSPRDVRLRALRRVIEIRDGCLNLAPYVDHRVAEAAHRTAEESGLSGMERDAVVEAVRISTALAACGAASQSPPAPMFRLSRASARSDPSWSGCRRSPRRSA